MGRSLGVRHAPANHLNPADRPREPSVDVKGMRTLVYKRTHSSDPDPSSGVFGNRDCMRGVRGWKFDAVIGIGGLGSQARRNRIDRKLTWVGVGPRKTGDSRRPLVTFDHFLYYGEDGPLFTKVAPILARHVYGGNVRLIMDGLSGPERVETSRILRLALKAPASRARRGGTVDGQRATRSTKC